MKVGNKERIVLHLEPSQMAWLRAEQDRTGASLSHLVRRALEASLKPLEATQGPCNCAFRLERYRNDLQRRGQEIGARWVDASVRELRGEK